METCRAAVITAHGAPLEIQDVPVPDLKPGALLVRMAASTICGTDVHRWRGPLDGPDTLPIIPGHEPCGWIETIDGDRTDILGEPVRPGDRIVWSYVACGGCYYCTVARQPCVCPGRASWGHSRSDQRPFLLGSLAEYMYVPPECQLIRVPEAVSSASAAAAACAYRTVMHGFDRLGAVLSHETVVIQGSGPLGIFAAAVAHDHGAKRVLVLGAPAARLDMARRMGADDVLNIESVSDPEDRRAWVRERTAGRGADIVIQAASNTAVREGLSMLRSGGRFVNIGAGGMAEIAVAELPDEMTFHTIKSGEPRHWLQALDFLETRAETYPFDDMITAHYSLDQVNDAMAKMAAFEIVKGAIDFDPPG